jgi:hypothetical protein
LTAQSGVLRSQILERGALEQHGGGKRLVASALHEPGNGQSFVHSPSASTHDTAATKAKPDSNAWILP